MKFNTREEICKILEENTGREHRVIISGIVNEVFECFAERINFYKKYKDNDELLNKEHLKIWQKQWNEFKKFAHNKSKYGDYNNWLFDYCFGDVIK